MRRFAGFVVASLAVLTAALLGARQTANAQITGTDRITVTVRYSNAPIAGARVVVRGAGDVLLSITGPDGRALFKDLPQGNYDITVQALGYSEARTHVRVSREHLDVQVAMTLTLKSIAHVIARPPVSITERRFSLKSPLGALSKDILDLLNRVGGANVLTNAEGSLLGVSLEGRDPRMTHYGFDGNRLPSPEALAAVDPSFLESARIDQAADTANFYTLQPTLDPEYDLRQIGGGFGNVSTRLTARGTSGVVGYLAQGVLDAAQSPLNGSVYRDTSGLTYRHAGGQRGGSMLVKISAPVAQAYAFNGELLTRASRTAPIDAFFAGSLPSGEGPNNSINLASSYAQAEMAGTLGGWRMLINASNISIGQTFDYTHAIVNTTPFPYEITTNTHITTSNLSLIRPIGDNKILNINVGLSALPSTTHEILGATPFSSSQSRQETSKGIEVTYDTKHARAHHTVDVNFTGFDGTVVPYLNYTLSNTVHAALSYFVAGGIGAKSVPRAEPQLYDNPVQARYDCAGDSIFAHAPNESADNVFEESLRVGGTLSPANSSVSFQIYDTEDRGLTVSQAEVPASLSLAGSAGAYAQQLIAAYTAIGGCATPPSPPQLFFVRDVTGLGVTYQGAELTAALRIGKRLEAQVDLNLHKAVLRSAPSELETAQSPYVLGKQLPATPPFDASITVDWAPTSHDQIAGNAYYESANNDKNLPAYVLVTAGVSAGVKLTHHAG